MKRLTIACAILVVLSLALVGCRTTKNKVISLPPEYPSKYEPWPNNDNSIADSVTFNKAIDVAQYDKITILPADFSKASFDQDQPGKTDSDEGNLKDAKFFDTHFDGIWTAALEKNADVLALPFTVADKADSGILLKTTVLVNEMGFHKSTLKVQVDLIDAKSGDTFVTFLDSKTAFDMAFNNYSGGVYSGSTTVGSNSFATENSAEYWFADETVKRLLGSVEDIAKDDLTELLKTLFQKPKS